MNNNNNNIKLQQLPFDKPNGKVSTNTKKDNESNKNKGTRMNRERIQAKRFDGLFTSGDRASP